MSLLSRLPRGPLLVVAAAVLLYGGFLSNPLVFDDQYLVDLSGRSPWQLRWLPYATLQWTRAWLGNEVAWLRFGNLALHAANGVLLFVFLRRLFEAAGIGAESNRGRIGLSSDVLALAGAMLFVLHPAAVHAVAYLAQRTVLMATMFALASWLFFLDGVVKQDPRRLAASVAAYLLAAFSKEHALMVPAVSLALLLLVRKPDRRTIAFVAPAFLLYGAIAAAVVVQARAIIAQPYEINAANMLNALGIEPAHALALSMLTQCLLFFKYLFLWLVPLTSFMAIDVRDEIAARSGPETAAALAFVLLALIAFRLILKRGRTGLLGFALASVWLLFATELSTARVQEVFVLYRSYLWMPCLAAALPFVFQKLSARTSLAVTLVVIGILVPLSWSRLVVFSDPVAIWDEALRLGGATANRAALGRMYHNRGVAYLDSGRYQEALRDFDAGIALLPAHSLLRNDRGVVYLRTGRYREALEDFEQAIRLDPDGYNAYLGRAAVHEAAGNAEGARHDYARSCERRATEVCAKALAKGAS